MKQRLVVATLALSVLSSAACTSSGSKPSGCDLHCQSNLAAADGTTLPPGPGFDYDTSKCSLWNKEPAGVRYYLTGVIAERLGAKDPKFALLHPFEKAITVTCKSYTDDMVKHVATVLMRADDKWPDA